MTLHGVTPAVSQQRRGTGPGRSRGPRQGAPLCTNRQSSPQTPVCNVLWVRLCERVLGNFTLTEISRVCLCYTEHVFPCRPCAMASDMQREGQVRITRPKWRRRGFEVKTAQVRSDSRILLAAWHSGLCSSSGRPILKLREDKMCAQWPHGTGQERRSQRRKELYSLHNHFISLEHPPSRCAKSSKHNLLFHADALATLSTIKQTTSYRKWHIVSSLIPVLMSITLPNSMASITTTETKPSLHSSQDG